MAKAIISYFRGDNSGERHTFAVGYYLNVDGHDVPYTVLVADDASTPNQIMESAVQETITSAPTGFTVMAHEIVLPNLVKG